MDISHQQSSAPSSSGGNTGGLNFSPRRGIDEKTLLIGVAVAVVVYLIISRSKGRK